MNDACCPDSRLIERGKGLVEAEKNVGISKKGRFTLTIYMFIGIIVPYNTLDFTGQTYDTKTDLVDMQARWYAPQDGRFTTKDTYRSDLSTS